MTDRRMSCRPWRGAALLILVLSACLPAAAMAQPDQTYRPGRKSEPRQAEPQRQERPGTQPQRREMKEEGRELFKAPARGQAESGSTWSIVLMAFRSETQQQDAQRALGMVQSEWSLPDAYIDRRGPTTVVAFGRYGDPQSQQAQADLRHVRSVEAVIDGEPSRPFEFAFLAPPLDIPGSQPEFDLRNAQRIHGRWAMYTLQVGIYRREDAKASSAAEIAEFRRLAEEAVLTLRREGEQAFYYHGPASSTVTIGLFSVEDFDPQLRLESPRLRTLRQRYPNNLLNGAGIKRRMTVTDQRGRQVRTERLDPSMLVAVPSAERN
jgi:hypothetical protein